MSAPLIELSGVRKTYTRGEMRVEVLRGVDLRIEAGEFVAILGASGSGKSTLLNLLGALARPSAGQYRLAGEDVGALSADALARLRRRYFGFVFQQYHLLGGLTAQENVELPAIYAGLDGADRRARARALLERLGLGDRLDHRPGQLSGGQQQRVSLARALMNDARIILADEPTGALDQATGREVLGLLEALNAEGRTIILVTHDPAVAARAPRRIEMVDGLVHSAGQAPPTRAVAPAPPVRDAGFAAAAGQAVRMALRTLHGNLLRTLLTLLGVVIGVAAVVAVVAFGAGARDSVIEQISAMGTDLLNVRPGAPNLRRAGNTITTLVNADALALADIDGVMASVPEAGGAITLRYAGVDHQTSLTATTAQFSAVRDWPVQAGVFFTDDDLRRYAPVAVLGQTTARNLFGDADPVGQFVLAGNVPLEVIGVLSSKGAMPFGGDQDDTLVVPLTTGQLRLLGVQHLQGITVRVGDRARMDAVQAQVEATLLARHNVLDFQVRSMAALLDTVTATQNTLTVLLGTVAAISLLVGGIGVMNIMLVSVSERTAEIGLRMATGARQVDILLQFAIEAVVVCAAGGLVGVALGALAAAGADALGVPIAPAPLAGLLAAGAALLTGLVFGQLPARRAAALDPVQALARE